MTRKLLNRFSSSHQAHNKEPRSHVPINNTSEPAIPPALPPSVSNGLQSSSACTTNTSYYTEPAPQACLKSRNSPPVLTSLKSRSTFSKATKVSYVTVALLRNLCQNVTRVSFHNRRRHHSQTSLPQSTELDLSSSETVANLDSPLFNNFSQLPTCPSSAHTISPLENNPTSPTTRFGDHSNTTSFPSLVEFHHLQSQRPNQKDATDYCDTQNLCNSHHSSPCIYRPNFSTVDADSITNDEPKSSFTSLGSPLVREKRLHSVMGGSEIVQDLDKFCQSPKQIWHSRDKSYVQERVRSYSSPYLHYTHQQAPRETHIADVDIDPISGRKIINQYEVVDELGRGVYGKVKLGRNLCSGEFVAIKIVDRYSKKLRLGRTNDQSEKIKREIAILKKARHENIVGLIEVIDDPAVKKVYIVLEHVEMGEVKWRTRGSPEICAVEYRRFQRLIQGVSDEQSAEKEDELIMRKAARRRQSRGRKYLRSRIRSVNVEESNTQIGWSVENGGAIDEFTSLSEGSSQSSIVLRHNASSHADLLVFSGENVDTTPDTSTHLDPSDVSPNQGFGISECIGDIEHDELHHEFKSNDMDAVMRPNMLVADGTLPDILAAENFRLDSNLTDFMEPEFQVPEPFCYVPLMTIDAARMVFRDTVLGLEYLHYQGVIHRDIKPANLLETRSGRIKISDFGVSYLGKTESDNLTSDADETIELAKTVGTPAFYAPELCAETEAVPGHINEQIDVWALGVTLYCLIYGRVPFHAENTFCLLKMIVEQELIIPPTRLCAADDNPVYPGVTAQRSVGSGKRLPFKLEYEEVGEELSDLLRRLLTKDPLKRIALSQVKQHPWVLCGIENPTEWLSSTDPQNMEKGKKIEVFTQDVAEAVASVTVVQRVRSMARKIGDAFNAAATRNTSRIITSSSRFNNSVRPSPPQILPLPGTTTPELIP